jgi:hypothetical protein
MIPPISSPVAWRTPSGIWAIRKKTVTIVQSTSPATNRRVSGAAVAR